MNDTVEHPGHTTGPEAMQRKGTRYRGVLNVLLAGLVILLVGVLAGWRPGLVAHHAPATPRSSAMEKLTGVRLSRVTVVGDGGLVTLFYVVIDSEAATRFQADRDHPPHLASEGRRGGTSRASIMRAGHQMRAGQTYYLVYENTRGAIRSGDEVSISYGGVTLQHVPVL